jgi:energy-coupling factor transporter ATP-binding protein EcfA2
MTHPSEDRTLLVRALGVPLGVALHGADSRERLARQWQRALVTDPDVEPVATVDLGAEPEELDGYDYRLTTRVTLAALRETAGRRLNLHAGGVAARDGRLLVLVGPSGTGKTTAVRALARRLGYVSDETVSAEPQHPFRVHAHPKPLSVVLDPARRRRKTQQGPDDLGLGPTPQAARVARVVLLRRSREGGGRPPGGHGLVPVPLPEAVLEVVPQTSSLVRLPSPLLTLTTLLRLGGGPLALEYAEIDEHVDELVALLDDPVVPAGPEPVHHPAVEVPDPGPGRWARSAWQDAVEVEDALMVLVTGSVERLDALGRTLWLACGRPRTVEQLVEDAQAEHGSHPDARRLVEDGLVALHAAGLLRAGPGAEPPGSAGSSEPPADGGTGAGAPE